MMRRLVFTAAVILLVASIASGEGVMLYGFKEDSCAKWSSFRDPHSRDTVAIWARGFISGYNLSNSTNQVTRELGSETVIAYIDKYCRDFPQKDFTNAVTLLICEMHDGVAKPFAFCEPKGK